MCVAGPNLVRIFGIKKTPPTAIEGVSHGIKQIHAGYFDNNSPDIIFDFLMCVKCVFFAPWCVFVFPMIDFSIVTKKSSEMAFFCK